MPLVQYFGWVGSILLAALVAASCCLPGAAPAPASDVPLDEKITIRIRSDRKWPERVQFDTARPEPGLAANPASAADVAPDQGFADVSRQDPFEAFAEMPPGASASAKQEVLVEGQGVPRHDRSLASTPARKGLTSPNPFHKPPGRS